MLIACLPDSHWRLLLVAVTCLTLLPQVARAVSRPAIASPGVEVATFRTSIATDTTPAPALSDRELRREIRRQERALRRAGANQDELGGARSRSGWPGIVALSGVALAGLSYLGAVATLNGTFGGLILAGVLIALVFGAIGMKRERRLRGLAIAGFVFGALVTAYVIAVIVAFAVSGW